MRTAMLAGATGLVGSALLQRLLEDPFYSTVLAVTRKPLSHQHEKLKNIVVDFDRLSEVADRLVADDIFCCLGTTIKQAGSKEAFWKVDHDYPLQVANITYRNHAKQFLLVSALGADVKSSFYYNVVKAKVEDAIAEIPFMSYHIFRPSLLLGDRTVKRPGEEAAKKFYGMFNFLIPLKYKGIEGKKVAAAMVRFAKLDIPGKMIHNSNDLQTTVEI